MFIMLPCAIINNNNNNNNIPLGYPLASDCSCLPVTGSSEVRKQSPGNHHHFCHYLLPLVDQLAH